MASARSSSGFAKRGFEPWADRNLQPLLRIEVVSKRFGEFLAVKAMHALSAVAKWKQTARLPKQDDVVALVTGLGFGPGVLDAEGVGDAFAGGVGLAVDAVSVDLEQDGDAAPVGEVLGTSGPAFLGAPARASRPD